MRRGGGSKITRVLFCSSFKFGGVALRQAAGLLLVDKPYGDNRVKPRSLSGLLPHKAVTGA